jgi:DNA-binding MarR family transcriptional regulator
MRVKETNKEKFIYMLYSLMRAIKDDSERCGEACGGLTEKEVTVLGFVGQAGRVKMSDIADDLDAPMSTVTKIIDRLVDKNILVREHSSDDRRAINVTLSEQGKTFYRSLAERKKEIAEELLSQYNEQGQELFLTQMNALISRLAKK